MAKPKNKPGNRKKKSVKLVKSGDSGTTEAEPQTSVEDRSVETMPLPPIKPRPLLFKVSLVAFVGWLVYLAYVAYVVLL